jgi:hypothetical protein
MGGVLNLNRVAEEVLREMSLTGEASIDKNFVITPNIQA